MVEAADRVVLKVGGRRFDGWKTVSVSKGIRDVAGVFRLDYAEKADQAAAPFQIRPGDACEVLIGDTAVIIGWVDAASPGFTADSRTLSVEGRDKAADLVDCAALNSPGVWKGRTLTQIATDLAAPFGLKVEARADVGAAFKTFAIQQGETVWEAIERLARMRGLLAISTATGDVAFIRPGQTRAGFTLRQGEGLLEATATDDGRDRFSQYVVKGQSAGDDEVNGNDAAGPKAQSTDAGVTRHRPILVVSEEQATLKSLQDRAAWEASTRAAAGRTYDLTVQGWRDPSGKVWAADQLVPVVAPWLDLDGELLIADVTFTLSNEAGSTTTLSCAPPDAYRPEPPEAEA